MRDSLLLPLGVVTLYAFTSVYYLWEPQRTYQQQNYSKYNVVVTETNDVAVDKKKLQTSRTFFKHKRSKKSKVKQQGEKKH